MAKYHPQKYILQKKKKKKVDELNPKSIVLNIKREMEKVNYKSGNGWVWEGETAKRSTPMTKASPRCIFFFFFGLHTDKLTPHS